MKDMKFPTRYLASGLTVALALLGLSTAASADSGAVGANGFTQVSQTRVFDSGRIAGDALLASGADQVINPNAAKAGLVPAGATAVAIQITAASETSVNGDLDAHTDAKFTPGSTSNLNYVKGVPVSSSTVVQLAADGTFRIYNHAGGAGSLRLIVDILGYYAPTATYTPPTTMTASNTTAQTITTGGPAATNSTDVVELTLTPGTYQVTVNAKATPPAGGTGSVQVFPQFFVYNQVLTAAFTGNEFNVGSGPLESGANANIDSYFSGSGLVTVAGPGTEELHIYAFGYDSDRGTGSYTLDSLNVTAVPVNPGS